MSISQSDWKWFGYPGHFICAEQCRFRLCTQVGNYLISTVGDMWIERNGKAARQTIGAGEDSFFETFVFEAGAPCIVEACGCGQPYISGTEIDGTRTATAGEAKAAHFEYCEKYAAIAATIAAVTP